MKVSRCIKELDMVAFDLHKKLFAEITEGVGIPITRSQLYTMLYIKTQGKCMATDIANYLGVTLGAVTNLVDRLHDFGLVNRYKSKKDRRLVIIKLNNEGEKFLEMIGKRREEVLNNYLKDMSEEEIEFLSKIIEKIISNILNT